MHRPTVDDIISHCNASGFFACPRRPDEPPHPKMAICGTEDPRNRSARDVYSFWVTLIDSKWLLGFWSYRYWTASVDADIFSIVNDCLREGQDFTTAPISVVEKHGLVEIDYDDELLNKIE